MAVLFLVAALGVLQAWRFIIEAADAMLDRENAEHDAYWGPVRADA